MELKNNTKYPNSIILQQTVQRWIGCLPIVGILMLIASSPFDYGWLQRSSLYLLALSYPLDYVINKRWRSWHWSKDKWVYVAMIVFFLITPIRQLFDPTSPTAYYNYQIDLRIPYLVVGVIGIIGLYNEVNIVRYVAYVLLAMSLVLIVYVGLLQINGVCEDLNLGVVATYNVITHEYVGSHMKLDLYWNTALIFGFYLLHIKERRWVRIVVGVVMLCIGARLFFTDGRSGLLAMLFIVGTITVFWLCTYVRRKWIVGILMLIVLCFASLAIIQNNRLTHEALQREPRLLIWQYTMQEIAKHPIAGFGLSTLSNEYVESAYQSELMQPYIAFLQHNQVLNDYLHDMLAINPHNLYLQLTLESGILFPILFLLIGLLSIFAARRSVRLYVSLFVFLVFWQAVFDSFSSHYSPMMVNTFLIVLLSEPKAFSHNDERHNPSTLLVDSKS